MDDVRKAIENEEEIQKQLFERHKRYDVNTTFLPRLDAPQSVNKEQQGLVNGNANHGVNVKSIAAELDQFEQDSETFPLEPLLRSKSARQAKRAKQQSNAVGAAAVPTLLPAAPQRQFSLPSVPGASGINR